MMKHTGSLAAWCIAAALFTSSCVAKKKYQEMSKNKFRLEAEKADCEDQLKAAQAQLDSLNALSSNLAKACELLRSDSLEKSKELNELSKNYKSTQESYENLSKTHSKFQAHSQAETNKLTQDLQRREKELLESERRIGELQASLQAREARVKELEKVLADKEQAVNDLKAKVSKALLSFKEKDLTVNVKNGKVYVSLSEQLLFKSGSAEVDAHGVEALKKLGEVLKNQKDISVMVEGHTDDVPVAKGTIGVKDNWDLSVLRATSIVRILVNTGVNPKSVVPAGRANSSPVAEGTSSEARQKNRRTEIIITPKLDELFQILESN